MSAFIRYTPAILGGGGGGGGGGSVTSVGLADGSTAPIYTISDSPVTSSGTLIFTLNTESANLVFAGPTTGSAAQPTFRSLVAADIPAVTSVSVTQKSDNNTYYLTFINNDTTGAYGLDVGTALSYVPSSGLLSATSLLANTQIQTPHLIMTGAIDILGSGSGDISILAQANAGTYNLNLPITAGNSGYFLTSSAGGSSPMTWTQPSTIVPAQITVTAVATNSTFYPVFINSDTTATYGLDVASTLSLNPSSGLFTLALLNATTSVSSPLYIVSGSSSGSVTMESVSGTYNFILPTTVGTSGYLLTSDAGSGAMTWTNPATFQPAFSGFTTDGVIYATSSSAIATTAAGTTGQVLTAVTSGAPIWAAPATSGTVTTVSVVTANNVTGTVSNPTTTPAITLAPTAATVAASSFASWDANSNLSANNLIEGFTTIATAGTTTTMTIASTYTQVWTGSTTQTVKLPTTSIVAGGQYLIINKSTGSVTVESSGANTIQVLAAGSQGVFTALVATPTTAANWSVTYTSLIPTLTAPTVQTFLAAPTGATNYSFTISSHAFIKGDTYTNNGSTFTVLSASATSTLLIMSGTGTPSASGTLTFSTGSGSGNITYSAFNGAYIPPLGVLYIEVEGIGAGGAGSGSGSGQGTGTNGGNTTFGTSLLVGNGGVSGGNGQTGGTASVATSGTVIQLQALAGGTGQGNVNEQSAAQYTMGGSGASSPFGGAGGGGQGGANGYTAIANSGSGGGGAGGAPVSNLTSGTGGGAGGYFKALITSPGLYQVTIGASGAGGAAGVSGYVGGASGSGQVNVKEFYQ